MSEKTSSAVKAFDRARGLKFSQNLRSKTAAKGCLLWCQTNEERRAELTVQLVANSMEARGLGRPFDVYVWRVSTGLFNLSSRTEVDEAAKDPRNLIEKLNSWSSGPAIVICEDLGSWLKDPAAARGFKDLGRKMQGAQEPQSMVQVLVLDNGPIKDGFTRIDLELPPREELAELLDMVLRTGNPETQKNIDSKNLRNNILDALMGLELEQAAQALAECLVETGTIDPDRLVVAKKDLISASGTLQWIDPVVGGLGAVGGLEILKTWLTKRRRAFSQEAREWGLPKPKGILAAGIPGTGKSLTAKAVSAAWQVPCLRFDVASAFGKFVGESEKGLREALNRAEAVAPCVLWIDEIEKAFAGSGASGDSDGGTTVRVFGQFLTWLQETKAPVFVIATANDPIKLPAELFRAGRFDAIFWVDVPNRSDREEVLSVLLKKYPRASPIDKERIVSESQDYTPAEIEQAIIESLYKAFDENRDITTEDVLAAMNDITPIIRGWKDNDRLKRVRAWAKAAARAANSLKDEAPAPKTTATKVVDPAAGIRTPLEFEDWTSSGN